MGTAKSKQKMPKKKACIQVVKPTSAFVAASFRFVPIPGPKNTKATIMIGCPKGKGHWKPAGRKNIVDRQGKKRVIVGVCTVGTRAHAKIQQPVRGRCRKGYTLKAFKPLARRRKTK